MNQCELFTPDTSSLDAKDWVILRLLRLSGGHAEITRHPDFANSVLFLCKLHGYGEIMQAFKHSSYCARKKERRVNPYPIAEIYEDNTPSAPA